MNSLRSLLLLLTVLAISLVGRPNLFAQSVQVRVLDAKSGARIPNEKVSVLIKGEKNARDYTTDNEGNFTLQLDQFNQNSSLTNVAQLLQSTAQLAQSLSASFRPFSYMRAENW